MAWPDRIALQVGAINERATITVLVWSYLALMCVSLVLVSQDVGPAYHIRFDSRDVLLGVLSVAAVGACVPMLALARGPLGFSVALYLLALTAGYLWLSYFTPLQYDHVAARVSAVTSWVAFALPALLVMKSPANRDLLTYRQMNVLAGCLIFFSAAVAGWGYSLGLFYFVGFLDAVPLRSTLNLPTWMRYAISISATAALPFAYAWFFIRKQYIVAVIALAILLAYYPITLTKTMMLTPFWLIATTVLLKFTSWRIAVVLSLLLPMILGLTALVLDPNPLGLIFRVINFRMLAIPSSAIDHYNHFFSTHPITHFCQIGIIGKIFNCTLPDQLGVVMAREYATGNYNASLLATEGIASVGIYIAPISAFFCGVVIAVGNIASNRLDPAFVFLSASVLVQTMMNVPLSTVMLTQGGIVLFALWFLSPSKQSGQKRDADDQAPRAKIEGVA